MEGLTEIQIFIFLVQIVLLLASARILGELFRRIKQPTITAEILVGILLGPTIFGRVYPAGFSVIFPDSSLQHTMLDTVAWLGILFFLLKTGMEMEFSSVWRQRVEAAKIAVTDVLLPMAIAFVPAYFLPARFLADPAQRFLFALFIATVMTISALPVTARVLHDLNIYRTNLGSLIMSALSINDLIGWIIFTLILGLVGRADPGLGRILFMISGTLVFSYLCLAWGRKLSQVSLSYIQKKGLPEPGFSITFIVLLGFICGAITLSIGIHALFGFFLAGIIVGEAKALSGRTRQIFSEMVHAIFVPIFFAAIGLKIDFLAHFNLFLVLLFSVLGIAGRYIGAWVGCLFTRQQRENYPLIAIAHTPGGEMQIVVAIIALQFGFVTNPVFVAILVGAILSSVVLGPWMNAALLRKKRMHLFDAFSRRNIIAAMYGGEKETVLEQLCELGAEHEFLPNAKLLCTPVTECKLEKETSYKLGAVFFSGEVPALRQPMVVAGRIPRGIIWKDSPGRIHLVFLLLVPHRYPRIRDEMLKAILDVLTEGSAREALLAAADEEEMWEALRGSMLHKYIELQ
ncbi:MAG: cation:proton antiporter [Candidatus Omnitrophota bacterium]